MLENNLIVEFYNKLINLILNAYDFINNFDDIIICGGSTVISKLNIGIKNKKIRKCTLYNSDYLNELKDASHCIMSPGLGNFVETINMDKQILYLPAINYSQFLQMKFYGKLNLGFVLMQWEKFENFCDVPEMLDEEIGVKLVLNNVKNFLKKDVSKIVNKEITNYLKKPQNSYFKKRREFSKKYYKDSSSKVAEEIYLDLKGGV